MILSSGIIPVCRVQGEWKFLLLRSYRYWDFPKGEVEPGEDPYAAALRELAEESGITEGTPSWGEDFAETESYGKGKIARYYLLEVAQEHAIKLLPNPETGIIEHHEARWVTEKAAQSLLGARVNLILKWAIQKLN